MCGVVWWPGTRFGGVSVNVVAGFMAFVLTVTCGVISRICLPC